MLFRDLLTPKELLLWSNRRFESEDYQNLSSKIIGTKLGTLTIVSSIFYTPASRRRQIRMSCSECLKTHTFQFSNLIKKRTVQCRCDRNSKYRAHKDVVAKTLSNRYWSAFSRCTSPRDAQWKNYGGRGIKMKCTIEEYIQFFKNNYTEDEIKSLQVDRVNNDGHYELNNLRLATPKENSNNKRPRVKI